MPLLTLLQQHSYDVSINDALRRRELWVWTELRSIPTCGQLPSKPSDGWKRTGWLVIIWMRVKSIILRLPRSWILDDVAEQMIRRGFVPISFGKIKCKRNQRSFTERMITWEPFHQDNENCMAIRIFHTSYHILKSMLSIIRMPVKKSNLKILFIKGDTRVDLVLVLSWPYW